MHTPRTLNSPGGGKGENGINDQPGRLCHWETWSVVCAKSQAGLQACEWAQQGPRSEGPELSADAPGGQTLACSSVGDSGPGSHSRPVKSAYHVVSMALSKALVWTVQKETFSQFYKFAPKCL